MDQQAFDKSYWQDRSQYRKFENYSEGLRRTTQWYAGFLRLIRRHLPAPGRHVDAGCGHGAITHLLAAKGFDAHGFDLSEWIVEQARHEPGTDPEVFAVGDFESGIPFEGTFCLITCLEVLEHIEDPLSALRIMRERLEPNGRLIATTPNLKPGIPWTDPLTSDPTHINVHEPDWWRERVIEAGLEVRALSTFMTAPLIWRLGSPLSMWVPLGATTGPGTLIVAERA